ncbi:MAG: YveK family protein [Agathobacter sp.]
MEKRYESDVEEIDLKELFFEVVAEWKKVLISTVLAAVIMYVVSAFILTPQYQSTSKLYLMKSGGIASLTDLQLGSNLATDYMEVIDGRPILDQVIENLSLDMTYKELKGMLTFRNPSSSRIIEITVTHPEPETAKAIADEIADVAATYIEKKMDQDKPSILQYGYVAEEPVSPSVIKNSVLGAFVGAFLAIAIIVITYLLNDTIMTPDDMERKVGLKVLASLPFDEEEDDGLPSKGKEKKSFAGGLKEFFKDDDEDEDERITAKSKSNKNKKHNK